MLTIQGVTPDLYHYEVRAWLAIYMKLASESFQTELFVLKIHLNPCPEWDFPVGAPHNMITDLEGVWS